MNGSFHSSTEAKQAALKGRKRRSYGTYCYEALAIPECHSLSSDTGQKTLFFPHILRKHKKGENMTRSWPLSLSDQANSKRGTKARARGKQLPRVNLSSGTNKKVKKAKQCVSATRMNHSDIRFRSCVCPGLRPTP